MQELLEACTSIKVKGLFLFLEERYDLPCFHERILDRLVLGSGKRVIGEDGNYNARWQLTLPASGDITNDLEGSDEQETVS